MLINEFIYKKSNMKNVSLLTLDPFSSSATKVYLIPPKFNSFLRIPSVAIINGQDFTFLKSLESTLLNIYIQELNKYSGKNVTTSDLSKIAESTLKKAHFLYPFTKTEMLKDTLRKVITKMTKISVNDLSYTEESFMPDILYHKAMKAPYRMDLMVSSMKKNNVWHCNQKCIHCYAANQRLSEVKELSTEKWKEIIDILRKIGVPQITFTGGEPTMREDLIKLIEYSSWFITRLNTNGINLTNDYCKALKDANLDFLQVTFYSNEESIHNALVGAKTYSKTLSGIQNAVNANLNVSINTPLCILNKNYLSTLNLLYDIGVRSVSCSGLIPSGNAKSEDSLSTALTEDELFIILSDTKKFCHTHNMDFSFTLPGKIKDELLNQIDIQPPTCGACLNNMAICPNGDVIPCQSWLSGKTNLGNILTDKWTNIWKSYECKSIRKQSSRHLHLCPLKNI